MIINFLELHIFNQTKNHYQARWFHEPNSNIWRHWINHMCIEQWLKCVCAAMSIAAPTFKWLCWVSRCVSNVRNQSDSSHENLCSHITILSTVKLMANQMVSISKTVATRMDKNQMLSSSTASVSIECCLLKSKIISFEYNPSNEENSAAVNYAECEWKWKTCSFNQILMNQSPDIHWISYHFRLIFYLLCEMFKVKRESQGLNCSRLSNSKCYHRWKQTKNYLQTEIVGKKKKNYCVQTKKKAVEKSNVWLVTTMCWKKCVALGLRNPKKRIKSTKVVKVFIAGNALLSVCDGDAACNLSC